MSDLAPSFRVLRCDSIDPDPALDLDTMTREKVSDAEDARTLFMEYVRDRDEKYLRLKDGVRPTWFHIKRLPAMYLTRVIDPEPVLAEKIRLAFLAAVHVIESPDGTLRCDPKASAPKGATWWSSADSNGCEVATAEWVQEVVDRWGAAVIAEIGSIALTQSRLPRGRRGPFVWWGGTALRP